jgi:hypothetical protein
VRDLQLATESERASRAAGRCGASVGRVAHIRSKRRSLPNGSSSGTGDGTSGTSTPPEIPFHGRRGRRNSASLSPLFGLQQPQSDQRLRPETASAEVGHKPPGICARPGANQEPEWNAAEVAVLERWGHLTDAVIQRKLKAEGFYRSVNAIHLKMKRMHIKQNLDGCSANALVIAFGVDGHKITYWINRRMLKATRRGTARTRSQGGDTYWITHNAVREFVLKHPDEIDLRKVEKWWFLDYVEYERGRLKHLSLLKPVPRAEC